MRLPWGGVHTSVPLTINNKSLIPIFDKIALPQVIESKRGTRHGTS